MDSFRDIGRYIQGAEDNSDHTLKRDRAPEVSVERIRDVFDMDNPFHAQVATPPAAKKILVDFNFGQRLPSLGCCADCLCGTTESYTSDSLVNGSIYVTQAYLPGSTVVYLDGVKADVGVGYIEANPTGKQIAIIEPSSSIVVSYVFTVGNCTESICVDERFECLDYTFLSGLTTVFSDRFDRPVRGAPSGGCGYYFLAGVTSPITFPPVNAGEATINTSTFEWVGGVDRLVGKSVEVLCAVNLDSMSISAQNRIRLSNDFYTVSFEFTKTSSTVMTLKIAGSVRQYRYVDDVFSSIDLTFFTEGAFDVETTIAHTGGRYWFRVAQMPDSWAMKMWPQFTAEPATQLSMGLSDSYVDVPILSDEIGRTLIQPTVNKIQTSGSGWEAIQVGAGLDNGDWNMQSLGTGALGHYCAEVPDGLIRFGYNCFPGNGLSTVVDANTPFPELFWSISYPSLPNGPEGRIITLDETVAGWHLKDGHPGGFRVRGQLVASVWDNPVTVQVKQYGTGPLTMGGINGIQGGQVITSYLLPKDGTPVDVDFFLSAGSDDFIRWGLHVENLDAFIRAQPQFNGAFLSPNNTGNVVQFYFLRAEAIQSVQCTTGPFCNDCEGARCPEVQDGFNTDNATRDFGTTDFSRQPDIGNLVFNDKGAGSKVEFGGNTMKTSFNASAGGFNFAEYQSPFDCGWVGDTNSYEAYFQVKLGTPQAAEFGSFDFGAMNHGPLIRLDVDADSVLADSFDLTPEYFAINPIVPGAWYSIRFRLEGTNFFLRIWPDGSTEPTSWSFEAVALAPLSIFGFNSDTSFSIGTSSFTTEIRDLSINRGV